MTTMDETAEERPVHLVVDCATGTSTATPLSDEEWEQYKAVAAQAEADRVAREAEDEQLRLAAAQHPDPLVQALARRAGL